MKELIKCNNVSLGYEGKIVVKDLSFTAKQGDYIFVVGENGSGKSTLIKGILSLIKPMSGDFEFGEGFCKTDMSVEQKLLLFCRFL